MVLVKYKIGLHPGNTFTVIEEEDIKNYGKEEVEEGGEEEKGLNTGARMVLLKKEGVVLSKKKTPTRTRRTIARLRTPITRKELLLQEEQLPQGQEGR